MMAASVCAQPGCPDLVPPGGGVRGYCAQHSNEAVIEAIERLTESVEAQAQHVAQLDLKVASIENVLRATAQQRRRP